MTVRLPAPRPGQGTTDLVGRLAELPDEAHVRIRLRSDAGADEIDALLGALAADRRPVTVVEVDDGVELDGGPRAAGAEGHDLAAAALQALVEARSDLRRLHTLLDQERRTHATRLDKVRDSTQYRLGAALLGVVRRPSGIVRLPRELRELQRRRVRPPVAPAATEVEPVDAALDLRTASILDEFTHDCFAPEIALAPLPRRNWNDELAEADLLFVESAWRGNRGAWTYTLSNFATDGGDLRAVVDAARRAGVPTVFWNKEDPVSFDVFHAAAGLFDVVLTTDADLVGTYRRTLGHDRVAALPFAAQPRLHNPIGRARGAAVPPRVCFAGAWRGDQYPHRAADLATLLDPPLARGVLDIYDRYADGPEAATRGFPEPYRAAVIGRLPYAEMARTYRSYAAFLNANSVADSPTTFSRRVFELLACGTPVISTPARGIEELLGDTVLATDSPARTEELVEWVVAEPDARDRHAHRGYRLVHREHTYAHRTDDLLRHAGVPVVRPGRRVSVICVSNRPGQLGHVIESYLAQTYADTEFLFVANSAGHTDEMLRTVEDRVPGARVLQIDEAATLGDCLNEALALAEGDYFAKFDDDDLYGPDYLTDLMLTFGYSGAAVAGKQSYYAWLAGPDRTVLRFPGREFRDAPRVVGGTIVADRGQVDGIAFEPLARGTDLAFLDAVRARGLGLFSADRYNFCQVRHADPNAHTWDLDESAFLRDCVPVADGLARADIFV